MTTRLATTVGSASVATPSAADATDDRATTPVLVQEPTLGAELRVKGCLYVVAHVRGDRRAVAAARDAMDAVASEYAHDLTGGVPMALARALATANRRLHHRRERLGIPARTRIGLVALVVRGREAFTARVGAATAVLIRDGRLYELPPPAEPLPVARLRNVAISAGEAANVEPTTWDGPLRDGDRLCLIPRSAARRLGADRLAAAVARGDPVDVARDVGMAATGFGAQPADVDEVGGIVVIALREAATTDTHTALDPVRAIVPLAGDDDVGAMGDAFSSVARTGRRTLTGLRRRVARAAERSAAVAVNLTPRRRVEYPRGIARTDELRAGQRRRLGALGMLSTAAVAVAGATVAGVPGPAPTDAIPRASVARAELVRATDALDAVDRRVGGQDLLDRDEVAAVEQLLAAEVSVGAAERAGVPASATASLRRRIDSGLDRAYEVRRVAEPAALVDLAAAYDAVDPRRMVRASDGSLWVLESGRGRVIRVDASTGEPAVVLRSGTPLPGGDVPGDPWLIATAATDVVVVDRTGIAWRTDLVELVPRRMALTGAAGIPRSATLFTALQHRPPLEIFALYIVDPVTNELLRWAPPPMIPVEFPEPPQPYLAAPAKPMARDARDLLVDANAWLLHASTVTRVDFGTPVSQEAYALEPPPDAAVRRGTDYAFLDATRIGERELLIVYDAAHDRILAFARADGRFVAQWLAGDDAGAAALADVRGLSVPPVTDGPPVAYVLTGDGVVRLVLE